jgi:hypothetical protein
MTYDSKIIIEFAARLYARANAIAAAYGVVGAVLGAVVGAIAARFLLDTSPAVGALVGGAVCCAIGVRVGQDKAFQLKLQAQIALCQVQIERNTRRGT